MTTPADELRTAAQRLREVALDVTGPLAGLADPVADWLDFEVDLIARVPGAELRGRTERALAVARAINGPAS